MQGSNAATPQGSNGAPEGRPVWESTVPTDTVSSVETYHLQIACERIARAAWRAVCNGTGRVDKNARAVFNAGRKAVADPGHTGDVVDAIAASIERRAKRAGRYVLRVDGVEFTVARVADVTGYTDCARCAGPVHPLAVFPGGVCLPCHAADPAVQEEARTMTADRLAVMWGGRPRMVQVPPPLGMHDSLPGGQTPEEWPA